jgi:Rieske Fe-S protein
MSDEESTEFARKLTTQYGLKVSQEVVASVYSGKPKLRVLLSRSSFRADAARTDRALSVQRERRNLLRNMLGFVGVLFVILVGTKVAFFSPQAQQPIYVSNPQSTGGERLLANASSISVNQSISFNDPTFGPFLLIHLDKGQFVAYSSICTHAGCQVQFNPSAKEIVCPCHGAVFDPNRNALVLAGPAPAPLQTIPIRYDTTTGNIYLA